MPRARRCGAKNRASTPHTIPVTAASATSTNAKSKTISDPRRSLLADPEHREERLLRDLHRAELLHALLALLLLLEELALARHVAAVALREHVLAQRLHRRARDHLAADRGLDRDLEHLARDQLLHLVDQLAAALVGALAVDDDRERVYAVAVDQHVEAHERRRLEVAEFVVERGVAAAHRLQPVEEVEHDLGEG